MAGNDMKLRHQRTQADRTREAEREARYAGEHARIMAEAEAVQAKARRELAATRATALDPLAYVTAARRYGNADEYSDDLEMKYG